MATICYPTFYTALESAGVTVNVILKDTTTWQVEVLTTYHVNKQFILSMQFSTDFTPSEVLNDKSVKLKLSKMFSVRPFEGFCIS